MLPAVRPDRARDVCGPHLRGRPLRRPPLLAGRSLPIASVALNYLCWHIVTLHLAVMSGATLAAALGWVGRDAVMAVIAMAASIFLVSLAAPLSLRLSPLRFPSTYMSVLIAAFALPGL